MNFFVGLSLVEWSSLATVFGVFLAAVALIFNAFIDRRNAQVAKAEFGLKLEDMFARYHDVDINLRPGGKWLKNGPTSREEWALFDDYLGLFEHCEIMMQKSLVDFETFDKLYGYRIKNIQCLEWVKTHLHAEEVLWKDFLRLLARFEEK